jgi:D-serine deaminase-like pyridoxal phosphate-dependent protein
MQQIQSFLKLLKENLESSEHRASVENLTVSVGSTPSARHHFSTVGLSHMEIHPGNYTLYDRQQQWTGACTEPDLAGRVISKVIGHYEDRNTIMLDAGALALTKDSTPQGGVCAIGGHSELDCYSMSQEVILVRPKDTGTSFPFDKFPLGSIVNLLPNHSCLAAACFEKYFVIDDPLCLFSPENTVVDEWIPAKFFALPI